MNEYKTMHLFAGHGGGLLADLILGHTPIVAVEWDAYACQVLRERAADGWFPGLRVWEGDVRLFDPSEYAGQVDCIHAGFPCTDLSSAGKQAGIGPETRSGLYREALRIACIVRPRFLFLENVSDIVTNGLRTVLADLSALGYDSEWLCLRASDCGASHERDRWWLLGHSNLHKQPASAINDEAQVLQSDGRSNFANSDGTRCEEGSISQRVQTEYTGHSRNSWWKTRPDLPGVANGLANQSHRLKGIGNGQVPIQAAAAWKLLGGR